jgi:hypothetical protein
MYGHPKCNWWEDVRYLNLDRIEAAKKALSIASRLKPSPYRGRHVSRIFKNLNKLRAGIR